MARPPCISIRARTLSSRLSGCRFTFGEVAPLVMRTASCTDRRTRVKAADSVTSVTCSEHSEAARQPATLQDVVFEAEIPRVCSESYAGVQASVTPAVHMEAPGRSCMKDSKSRRLIPGPKLGNAAMMGIQLKGTIPVCAAAIRSNSVSSRSGQSPGHSSRSSAPTAFKSASAWHSSFFLAPSPDGGMVLVTWSSQQTKSPRWPRGRHFFLFFSSGRRATFPGQRRDWPTFRKGICSAFQFPCTHDRGLFR
jgi:hypothetical protein